MNYNKVKNELIYLKDTKEIIRQSIEDKGVEVDTSLPFRQYADKIEEISGGGPIENYNVEYQSANVGRLIGNTAGVFGGQGTAGMGNYLISKFDITDFYTADNWEIQLKFNMAAYAENVGGFDLSCLLGTSYRSDKQKDSTGFYLYVRGNNINRFILAFGNNSSWVMNTGLGDYTVSLNKTYIINIKRQNLNLTASVKNITDGDTDFTQIFNTTLSNKDIYNYNNSNKFAIGGVYWDNYYNRTSKNILIYLDESFVKWDKSGVETRYYLAE